MQCVGRCDPLGRRGDGLCRSGRESVESGCGKNVFVGELRLVNVDHLVGCGDVLVSVCSFLGVFVSRGLHRVEFDPVGFVFHEVDVSQQNRGVWCGA